MNSQTFGIKLNQSQKLWLKEIVKYYFNKQKPDLIALRIILNDKLEEAFDFNKVDYRLIRSEGSPTLFGIWVDNPENPVILVVHKVIESIRDSIKANPTLRRFEAKEIASQINSQVDQIELCLDLIYSIGGFASSGSSSVGKFGLEVIEINNVDIVLSYLNYSNIESIWRKFGEKAIKNIKSADAVKGTLLPSLKDTIANTAFIIMRIDPNDPEAEDINNTIKEVCRMFGIQAERSDDSEHAGKISELVLSKIVESEFLLADMTGERPNVYYEVGYAHALNKRPIMFRKQNTRLHFDLADYNVPEYRNITDLKNILIKRFEAITGRKPKRS